ncbi:MAG: ubiquinone/menaquinone biosynthesis methyltransferase [Anaerolineaceae bacterium]|jgi:demethylmenaquinone methyltransferase/2-methoxy-6-polyprenyl-1,4-benzoquinol methylase
MTSYDQPKQSVVRALFGRIAPRYDLLNRIMTFGQDGSWRKQAIRQLHVHAKKRLLDVGAGTGDLSLMIAKENHDAFIIGLDISPAMLSVARQRPGSKGISWVIADAQHLPFGDGVFDGVISGFLLRNVTDLIQTIREQARVLAVEGNWVAMETTPLRNGWLRSFALLHLRFVIPLLGRVIARNEADYRYLPQSIEDFVSGEHLADLVVQAGFCEARCNFRMLGTVSIVFGRRCASDQITRQP